MAILASAPWRTAAATAATRIPIRLGLERHRNRRWLTRTLPAEDVHKPVLVELGRLLEALEIDFSPLRYRLDVARCERELAAAKASIGPYSYVALHPFASHETRCVTLSEWADVASQLSSEGMRPLWIGTAKELERLRRLRQATADWHYSDILFGGSLTMVAAGIAGARLFIGHDSGPLHIASAMGVPSVGVFSPGEPERTFPQGTGAWRIITRNSPGEITARDIIAEAHCLWQSP